MSRAMRMTIDEIKQKGFAALMKELGPAGYVRFMQQFVGREGNYTQDREQWLKATGLPKAKTRTAKKRAGKSRK